MIQHWYICDKQFHCVTLANNHMYIVMLFYVSVALSQTGNLKNQEYRRMLNLKLSDIRIFLKVANLALHSGLALFPPVFPLFHPSTFTMAHPASWSLWSGDPGLTPVTERTPCRLLQSGGRGISDMNLGPDSLWPWSGRDTA
jgi:hypothetical protein